MIDVMLKHRGITDPNEQATLRQKIQDDVFERFIYKVISVGRSNDIETVRLFLTRHNDSDRQAIWQLMQRPDYQKLLADSWEEELSLVLGTD